MSQPKHYKKASRVLTAENTDKLIIIPNLAKRKCRTPGSVKDVSSKWKKCRPMVEPASSKRVSFLEYLRKSGLKKILQQMIVNYLLDYAKENEKPPPPSRHFCDVLAHELKLGGKDFMDKVVKEKRDAIIVIHGLLLNKELNMDARLDAFESEMRKMMSGINNVEELRNL